MKEPWHALAGRKGARALGGAGVSKEPPVQRLRLQGLRTP